MKEINRFEDLKGETILKINGCERNSNELVFTLKSGKNIRMFSYDSDCGNDVMVYLQDIIGDVQDIINSPLLLAEEVSNKGNPEDEFRTSTWTFYKLSTIKGSLTMRWLGESNSYYSETLDVVEI